MEDNMAAGSFGCARSYGWNGKTGEWKCLWNESLILLGSTLSNKESWLSECSHNFEHNGATCCCNLQQGGNTRHITVQPLQRNIVARKCCPYYFTLTGSIYGVSGSSWQLPRLSLSAVEHFMYISAKSCYPLPSGSSRGMLHLCERKQQIVRKHVKNTWEAHKIHVRNTAWETYDTREMHMNTWKTREEHLGNRYT